RRLRGRDCRRTAHAHDGSHERRQLCARMLRASTEVGLRLPIRVRGADHRPATMGSAREETARFRFRETTGLMGSPLLSDHVPRAMFAPVMPDSQKEATTMHASAAATATREVIELGDEFRSGWHYQMLWDAEANEITITVTGKIEQN